MMNRKTWKEFQDSKLLWWVNRMLHIFGWSIMFLVEKDGQISDVFPARVSFRGFDRKTEEEGFAGLTQYIKNSIDDIYSDTEHNFQQHNNNQNKLGENIKDDLGDRNE